MSGSLFDQYKAALRRGHVSALAGDLDLALRAYAEASRLVPERALPVASQGIVLHRMDRWPEAAAAFDLALRMAPDDEAALRARANAREERGLRSGAAADFERLAFVLDVAGRSADAAEAARRAADLEPSSARASLSDRLSAAAVHAVDLVPARRDVIKPAQLVDDEPEAAQRDNEMAGIEGMAPESEVKSAASIALEARIAELGTQPKWVDMSGRAIGVGSLDGDGQSWPPVDLPSPPPPPIEGPPPDPETLLAEAAALIAAGDTATARDRMLIAVMVHRDAGRLDAALEVCLQLLSTAPGDPQVHLAIANLQLDRGWTAIATEKIELLLRLTALTGDTQAEADVHGLASERLRDDAVSPGAAR